MLRLSCQAMYYCREGIKDKGSPLMLAIIIAILIIGSVAASVLVIIAAMFSSRLSQEEEHYLVEDYEMVRGDPVLPTEKAQEPTW